MQFIILVLESIGLIMGSLVAALLLCLGLSRLLRLARHPDWILLPAIALVPAAFLLSDSEFVRMTVILAMLMAIPLWMEDRPWPFRPSQRVTKRDGSGAR